MKKLVKVVLALGILSALAGVLNTTTHEARGKDNVPPVILKNY